MITSSEKLRLQRMLADAFDDFISVFNEFDEQQINGIPIEGSWSPGQVAWHIILATDGVPDGETEPAARSFDTNVEKIRPWWTDLNQKFDSPAPLRPDDSHRTKTHLLTELNRVKEKDLAILNDKDLTSVCLDFELPGIGHLTRYEWLCFIETHLRRHSFQLNRIQSALKKPGTASPKEPPSV